MRFKSTSFKLTSCLLLLVSATGLGFAKGYRHTDFKCEVPSCPCPPAIMDGFYVGGDVGYDIMTSRARFHRNGAFSTFFTDNFIISGNPRIAATGWDAGLFLGYGKYFGCDCNWYLGGELWGNWSSASDSINITTPNGHIHAKVDSNGDIGIGILPGVKLNHTTLAYFRLGYDWGRVDYKGSVTVFTPGLLGPVPTTFSNSHNNNRNGWVFGLGLETLLCGAWSVRAESDYLCFGNGGGDHSHFGAGNSSNHDYRFSVGLNYHFCL